MKILQSTSFVLDSEIESLEKELTNKLGEPVVIIPAGFEVVSGFDNSLVGDRKGITYHDNSKLENMR